MDKPLEISLRSLRLVPHYFGSPSPLLSVDSLPSVSRWEQVMVELEAHPYMVQCLRSACSRQSPAFAVLILILALKWREIRSRRPGQAGFEALIALRAAQQMFICLGCQQRNVALLSSQPVCWACQEGKPAGGHRSAKGLHPPFFS